MTSIVVIQPEVPAYRVGFFARLSARLGTALVVHASEGVLGKLSERTALPAWQRQLGPIRSIVPGLCWQFGAFGVPMKRGDILILWGNPRCLSNLAVLVKARAKGVKTVWWGHYRSSTSKGWSMWLRLRLLRLADGILFYTDQERIEYLSSGRNFEPERVFATNNGIETDAIVRLRAPYDAASRPRRLLFIGRLTPKARVDLLLHALSDPSCSGIELAVIGDGEREPSLKALAEELNLAKRIHWHGGTTDERQIAAIANESRVFIYPGAVGLSLIHGMSYGLAAIVHDDRSKHGPEFAALRPRLNGLTFSAGDWQSLAAVLSTVISDEQCLNAMSLSAMETTATAFNTEDMADRFCDVIRVLGGSLPALPARKAAARETP